MADDAENVLELDAEALDDEAEIEGQADEAAVEGDDHEEDVIAFADDDTGSASPEGESSTIREMRLKLREAQRENAQLRRQVEPQRIELGPKPTLESCDYDETAFATEFDDWMARKAKADAAEQDTEAQYKAKAEEWAGRVETYKADKARLRVSDYDAAEEDVFSALSEQQQALLMLTEKPAVLIYALAKNPARLEELSKLDPARAALMIGKMEAKITVTSRSKAPAPDRPLRGNAALGGSDKELARLEKEAERTGDRTALIRYRKSLSDRAK